MALKIKIKADRKQIEKGFKDAKEYGRYNGPLPEPGEHEMVATRMWVGESKAGEPMIRVSLKITNPDSPYKGYSLIHNVMLPLNPDYEYFSLRVTSLNDLLDAVSGGKYSVYDFIDDANAGRIRVDGEDRLGQRVTGFGNYKFVPEKFSFPVMLKEHSWDGRDLRQVHYIVSDRKSVDEDEPKSDDVIFDDQVEEEDFSISVSSEELEDLL